MTIAVPSMHIPKSDSEGVPNTPEYVDIELKCTHEYVERGAIEPIELKYASTKEPMADIPTKRLQTPLVPKFVEKVPSK